MMANTASMENYKGGGHEKRKTAEQKGNPSQTTQRCEM